MPNLTANLDIAVIPPAPLITGEHVLSDASPTAQYGLTNLDVSIVTLAIGPNAVGVVQLASFINNGDGTGSFYATFDTAVVTRELTLIAIDGAANESPETAAYIVNSLEQARLGSVFSIAPQPAASTPACNRLLDSIPESNFILKRQYTVAYSFNPTVFELRVITPNSPVEVVVLRRGLAGDTSETQRYVVTPQTEVHLISVRLGRGVNVVTAYDAYGRADTVMVAATTYAGVLCSYAREIYNYSRVEVDEQTTAIYSPVSTRLAEPLLRFTDLLPDVRSQQVLAAKLAIRSLVASPGKQAGVRDMLTALTLSTPIFVPQTPDNQYFDPIARPLFNSQEAFGGVEAHVWLANACVQRWLAFINYIQNADAFQLLEVSENEVLFRDGNGDLQRHTFDFTAQECSLTTLALQALCFDTIDVLFSIYSTTEIAICSATYPLDLRPTPSHPVNPISGEASGELALDPGFNGYVDFSLSDHWDSDTPLDSLGPNASVASGEDTCHYSDGLLIAPVLLASCNVTADAAATIDIVPTPQTATGAFLDMSITATGVTQTANMDLMIQSGPTRVASMDMQIYAIQTVGLELDVVIREPTITVALDILISA